MKNQVTSAIRTRRKRSAQGQSIVELCAGLIVGIPLILAGIDLGFIALGATINDNVCRDAARAAASGPPAENTPAFGRKVQPGQSPHQRVLSVIRKHSPTNLPMKVLERTEITENVRDVPPVSTGGAVDGDIAVKTTVTIIPPFVLRAWCPEGIELCSKHLLPFTYVILPAKKKAP